MTAAALCNYKLYDWPPEEFIFNTCFLCHVFLFNGAEPPPDCQNGTVTSSSRIHLSASNQSSDSLIYDIGLDCSHLSNNDCSHWRQCCEAADSCCRHQLKWKEQFPINYLSSKRGGEVIFNNSFSQETDGGLNGSTRFPYCQPTWDGFSCFEWTPGGATVARQCPRFYNPTSGFVFKHCEANGTWFAKDGQPWTGYNACVPAVSTFKFAFGLSLSCLSIITLAFSILTFLWYRRLRRQIRTRIHIHLFLTILLYNLAAIPNDLLFVIFGNEEAQLVQMSEQSYVWTASVSGMRFFKVTNFSWMFCEGLYLLRLLKNGLKPPRRASIFYAIGWGSPVIVIFAYYATKFLVRQLGIHAVTMASPTSACEGGIGSTGKGAIENANEFWVEWIVHLPCLISLAANYLILCAIVRIMTVDDPQKDENMRLRRAPSSISADGRYRERENLRKAARAIFLLSPLLGTYTLFTLVKSPDVTDEKWQEFRWLFNWYELIQTAADRIQGFVVSIAFCLSVKGVVSLYKQTLLRHNANLVRRHSSRMSSNNNLKRSASNGEGTSAFPLTPVTALATISALSVQRHEAENNWSRPTTTNDSQSHLHNIPENVNAER